MVDAEVREIRTLIEGAEDSETMSALHAVLSHQALGGGRLQVARAGALERGRLSPTNAPSAYCLAARAALWSVDVIAARADLASLDATHAHGPAITLHKATIRAGIAALEGRPADALAGYREALPGWRRTGLPVLEAVTAIDMATLLDPDHPEVVEAGRAARRIFTDLSAGPFLERLEEAMSHRPRAALSPQGVAEGRAIGREASRGSFYPELDPPG